MYQGCTASQLRPLLVDRHLISLISFSAGSSTERQGVSSSSDFLHLLPARPRPKGVFLPRRHHERSATAKTRKKARAPIAMPAMALLSATPLGIEVGTVDEAVLEVSAAEEFEAVAADATKAALEAKTPSTQNIDNSESVLCHQIITIGAHVNVSVAGIFVEERIMNNDVLFSVVTCSA